MPAAESEKRQVVHEMIYNELIKAILRLIHKLDLTTTKCSKADVQVISHTDRLLILYILLIPLKQL